MPRTDLPTGTVTFVFTDVEGSTRLLHEHGERYAELLAAHRRLLREAFARHGGVEVDTQGDAFFYAFARASDALAAAEEGRQALAETPVRVRIGIHTGEPQLTEEGYVGLDVHKAARIAAAGHGGQVLVSEQAARLARASDNVLLADLGVHRLKDLSAPERLYQLGEGAFGPLRTVAYTNLPRPASSLVGREREAAEVVSLVREGARLLTLSGPGGSGKTRLAIAAATELVPHFANGVFWVGLAPLRDPSLVIETVAQTLAATNGLAEHVGGRQLLLLLDNFEHVVDAAPEVASLLEACPNLQVLVTSRERLRVRGEVEYQVPPLADREAVELFSARSRVEPDETVAELCRRLDNLPLAVELAAARTSVLSAAQILGRLSQRLDLLKGGRDAEARQQTLRATIEWSYELLSVGERQLLWRLSVFAGGCTLEAAEEVAEADVDVLHSLVDKSLVRHGGERFSLLETIRQYAVERLEQAGDADELRARHAAHYAGVAEDGARALRGPAQLGWLERLDAEHGNLRAALAWALAGGDPALGARLAAALGWFWQLRSYLGEGETWLAAALASATDPAVRAGVLDSRGRLAYYRDQYEDAERLLTEAAALWRGVSDRGRESESLTYLGLAKGNLEKAQEARETLLTSIELARGASDDWTLGLALWALGAGLVLARLEAARPAEAREALEESVARLRPTGDRWALAASLFYLGLIAARDGDGERALVLVGEATDLLRAIGDKWRLAVGLRWLARLVDEHGDAAAAERLRAEAAAFQEELGRLRALAS